MEQIPESYAQTGNLLVLDECINTMNVKSVFAKPLIIISVRCLFLGTS